jgi:formylglycine-generating enzyme required for sulfatase activity/protocatechuate 3,4-dioxygenase beta subunit
MLTAGRERAPESKEDGLKMEFIRIPAGSFHMGSPSSELVRESDESPIHEVRITKPFYMGRYEVTQSQWKAVMGTTLCQQRHKADSPWLLKGNGSEYPMYYVSWEEAMEFCKRLGGNFRLPTEAEWEYACRAGSQTRFCYGDDPNYSELEQYAWYYGESDNKTHPVGQKKPNAWGLYDMHGNVDEWCSDPYEFLHNYEDAGSVDPTGPALAKNSLHVFRGGSWLEKPKKCRSANREGFYESVRLDFVGFRVVYTGQPKDDKETLDISLPEKAATVSAKSKGRPQTITGIVHDQVGMPIDDVEMRIRPSGDWLLRMYAKGRFEAYKRPRNSDSEEHYLLVRHVERNLAATLKIVEDANMLDVKLEPGVILTGKVVDAEGKALEGAIVGTALQGSDWRAIIPPAGMKTNAEGKFTFRALPIGNKYSFYARLLHYRPTKFEFNTGDERDNRKDLGPIVLARGEFSVSGVVVDPNGKPVANAWVFCTGKNQVGINSHTDAKGRFNADGIFEGQVEVIANIKQDNGRWLSGSIKTEAGANNVRVELGIGGAPPPKGRTCFPVETDVWVNGTVVQISKVVRGQTVGKNGCVVPTAARD